MGDFWCPWYDVAWEINWRIIKLNENSILYLFLANSLWSVLLRINKNTMKVNSFDLASWTLFIRESNILPLDFKSMVFVFWFQTRRKQFQIEVVLKPLYAFLLLWKKNPCTPKKGSQFSRFQLLIICHWINLLTCRLYICVSPQSPDTMASFSSYVSSSTKDTQLLDFFSIASLPILNL